MSTESDSISFENWFRETAHELHISSKDLKGILESDVSLQSTSSSTISATDWQNAQPLRRQLRRLSHFDGECGNIWKEHLELFSRSQSLCSVTMAPNTDKLVNGSNSYTTSNKGRSSSMSFLSFTYHAVLQMVAIIETTWIFYRALYYYAMGAGSRLPYDKDLSSDSTFGPFRVSPKDSLSTKLFKQNSRIHLYSIASNFYLWSKPHYRKGSFQQDLRDNLRNVAIPRTGIPLSVFVLARPLAVFFLVMIYPMIAFVASLHLWYNSKKECSLNMISDEYKIRLLAPNDWFNYWRLNCNIVGLHSYLNEMPSDYKMENKWEFLKIGKQRGVPISPFIDNLPSIVMKHKNEEGGMGIHFYRNAVHGGDWIVQERLQNNQWVQSMLPTGAPLSTFRVITISRFAAKAPWETDDSVAQRGDIKTMSCVFRAGRANAPTDHGSILFDVDINTGKVKGGTTNAHWYQLGINKAMQCGWRSFHNEYDCHPDDATKQVTGCTVPDIGEMLKLVEESHLKLCPKVPICGWDVALTTNEKAPVCLLEVNLSCNFFRGTFDLPTYLDFVDANFSVIQSQRLKRAEEEANPSTKHKVDDEEDSRDTDRSNDTIGAQSVISYLFFGSVCVHLMWQYLFVSDSACNCGLQ